MEGNTPLFVLLTVIQLSAVISMTQVTLNIKQRNKAEAIENLRKNIFDVYHALKKRIKNKYINIYIFHSYIGELIRKEIKIKIIKVFFFNL